MTLHVMAAYVAHELNHPLGTIINLTSMLSRRLAGSVVSPKEIGQHIQGIKEEAIRAASVIRTMRMLAEHKPGARESLCLIDVCRDTISRVRPLTKVKRVGIRLEIRTGRTRVQGVKELLETALYNFIINSIAVLDNPAFARRLVTVRITERDRNWAMIQILDNGPGVPDAIRAKISEPFITTHADGSGLGLAIASDIMRWHCGRISCSPRKRGTCMEMILPREQAKSHTDQVAE